MQRPTGFEWTLDQQSRDMNANDNAGSSTSSGSPPPFSAVSTVSHPLHIEFLQMLRVGLP
jgi:hypothetical protein